MHHVRNSSRSKGFSLIELIITLLLSVIAFTALGHFFSMVLISDNNMEKQYIVNEGGNNILTILQRDLARAGFMQRSTSSIATLNPFIYADNTLFQLNAAKNCITYRYDRDKNGELNNEYYGFRLLNNTVKKSKGSIQNCDDTSGWESLTDTNNIKVTQLTFSLNNNGRKAGVKTKTYIDIEINLEHKLLRDSALRFKRNVMTRVVL